MNIALILAGGMGTRFGSDIPKQYIELNGKPVISYCLDKFTAHPLIDSIQIVADDFWRDYIKEFISSDKFRGFSSPGNNRQLSIFNGLSDIEKYSSEDDIVIIHDAARPLISEETITLCLETAANHDGALPVLPMKDTVYLSDNGNSISSLLDRNKLFAGQAPEAFVFGKYYEANKALFPEKILSISGSTEPAVLAGMDIAMIAGDENNFKITTRADFERFKEYINR
ncbi:MAG: IspD/TarI family cytidylyltransferase [Oscillospiraceae bacterium]|nr:IspD/TarI family cytidylyltransferase [Oscillospiraceae bacterium]